MVVLIVWYRASTLVGTRSLAEEREVALASRDPAAARLDKVHMSTINVLES